jgi:hypothetical protein
MKGCVLRPLCAGDAQSNRDQRDRRRAFPQVNPSVVGLAGLEPAASSLSGISPGCVQADESEDGQLIGAVLVTVVVRWVPGLSVRCGTQMARLARTIRLTRCRWRYLGTRRPVRS